MDNIGIQDMVVKNIHMIIKVSLKKNDIININNRKDIGLIFAENGTLNYQYKGKNFISDTNHALLLPENIDYSLLSNEDSSSFVINFSINNPLLLEEIKIFNFKFASIEKILSNLSSLWTFKVGSYKHKCMSGLYEILSKLDMNHENIYFPKAKFNCLKPAINYLEQNFNDPNLCNDQLAQISDISTVYFRKLFTQKYGISPMKYIKDKRIEKAKDLLRSQYFSSISYVSDSVGFNSIYHFCRTFKKETGFTPTEFTNLCN